jgi:hypothetical protein
MLRDDGEPELAHHWALLLGDRVDLELGQVSEHLIGSGEIELRQAGKRRNPALSLRGLDRAKGSGNDALRLSLGPGHDNGDIGRPQERDLLRQRLVVGAGQDQEGVARLGHLRDVLDGLEGGLGPATVIGVAAVLRIDIPVHGHHNSRSRRFQQGVTRARRCPYSEQASCHSLPEHSGAAPGTHAVLEFARDFSHMQRVPKVSAATGWAFALVGRR